MVVGATQRAVQGLDVDIDAELAEGDGVDGLPRGFRPHDGVADVEEDGSNGGLQFAHG